MTAAVRLPNINPIIKIDIVFFNFLATTITAESTKKAPILAASANPKFEKAKPARLPPKSEIPRISIATPKPAPELIPKTKGPANGFLNNVCINKPLIDKPEPTKMAVNDFGKRKFNIIYCQDSFDASVNTLLKISFTGI